MSGGSYLSNKAKTVAELVDLVVAKVNTDFTDDQFANASKVIQKPWPSSANNQPTLNKMLDSFRSKRKHASLQDLVWIEMDEVSSPEPLSDFETLTEALQNFSQHLAKRNLDPGDRTDNAIAQYERLLSVMRFHHVIILMQLTASLDSCVSKRHIKHPRSGLVGSLVPGAGAIFGVFNVMHPSFGWSAWTASCGLAAGFAAYLLTFGIWSGATTKLEYLKKEFNEMIQLSLNALDLSVDQLTAPETAIAERLSRDEKKAEDPAIEEKWRMRLEKGIKNLLGRPFGTEYTANTNWAKWLFAVGRVGNLRTLVVDRLFVGIQGPTEAGKSLLLTTLTNAPKEIFQPGSAYGSRTTEIQPYTPPRSSAVFCDTPGNDDRHDIIKETARLFQDLMDITIFVIPRDCVRSTRNETVLKEIVQFIKDRKEPRPFRILVNKVDTIDYRKSREQAFKKEIIDLKGAIIKRLRELGGYAEGFRIRMRKPFQKSIVVTDEKLEDIVHCYSTYGQTSEEGYKALSDCGKDVECIIESLAKHATLYRLAEEGLIWDVETLRQWLIDLAPDCLPRSRGRVLLQHD